MKEMSLREKIGQLIITGFPSPALTEDITTLSEQYKIGNFILFTRNVQSTPQVKQLCGDLQAMACKNTGHPAFIAIDQEGGVVTRLPKDASNIPGAMAIASTGKPEYAYQAGALTALELKALGINFNLAPVLDINCNKANPSVNVRSYGDTKQTVSLYGTQMLKGLQDNRILACIKHFPGHGDTTVDSHLGLPTIPKSAEELENNELVPFQQAIAQGAQAVMTAHILFPALESEKLPSTMSHKIVTGLLREKLGFEGLIVSDCLEMDAIRKVYGTAKGAVAALKAGVNMVFISHTASLVMEAVEAIEQAVRSGELPEAQLDASVQKVLEFKKIYAFAEQEPGLESIVGCPEHCALVRQISEESLCLIRGDVSLPPVDEHTLFVGSGAYRSTLVSSQVDGTLYFPTYMAEKFHASGLISEIDPTPEEIDALAEKAKPYHTVVVGTYNGFFNPGQIRLANRMAKEGHPVIVTALRSPYDLGELNAGIYGLAVFEYSELAFDSLGRVLGKEIPATGKLSVKM